MQLWSLICVVVQSLSCVQLFVTLWTAARQASLSITISQSFLKLMCVESVMPSNHLILCHPLLLLHSVFPSIRIFSKESTLCIRWSKYWSFSISPSIDYSGLISFRTDCLELLAVQGTQESSPAPQFESISSSVLSLLYGSTSSKKSRYMTFNPKFYLTLAMWPGVIFVISISISSLIKWDF